VGQIFVAIHRRFLGVEYSIKVRLNRLEEIASVGKVIRAVEDKIEEWIEGEREKALRGG